MITHSQSYSQLASTKLRVGKILGLFSRKILHFVLESTNNLLFLHPKGYNRMKETPTKLAAFVKEMRRKHHLTQIDLADKSGVGLNFVRNLEQGKPTFRLDKINQVLALFKAECGHVNMRIKHSVLQ